MPAVKQYSRINFENVPSHNTPLNATNLNKMDEGIDKLDDLLVTARNNIDSLQQNATADEAAILALQGDIASLNGFIFFPAGEVDLVALVADDSFYTDSDGKYVIATSTTGQAMIDGITYKALASTEDTRGMEGADTCSPFSPTKEEIVTITATVTSSSPMDNTFTVHFNHIILVGIIKIEKPSTQDWGYITKIEQTSSNEATIKIRKYGSGSYGTINIAVTGIGR